MALDYERSCKLCATLCLLFIFNLRRQEHFFTLSEGHCMKNAATWRKFILFCREILSLKHTLQGLGVWGATTPLIQRYNRVPPRFFFNIYGVTDAMKSSVFYCFRVFRSCGSESIYTLFLNYSHEKKTSKLARSGDLRVLFSRHLKKL